MVHHVLPAHGADTGCVCQRPFHPSHLVCLPEGQHPSTNTHMPNTHPCTLAHMHTHTHTHTHTQAHTDCTQTHQHYLPVPQPPEQPVQDHCVCHICDKEFVHGQHAHILQGATGMRLQGALPDRCFLCGGSTNIFSERGTFRHRAASCKRGTHYVGGRTQVHAGFTEWGCTTSVACREQGNASAQAACVWTWREYSRQACPRMHYKHRHTHTHMHMHLKHTQGRGMQARVPWISSLRRAAGGPCHTYSPAAWCGPPA